MPHFIVWAKAGWFDGSEVWDQRVNWYPKQNTKWAIMALVCDPSVLTVSLEPISPRNNKVLKSLGFGVQQRKTRIPDPKLKQPEY